MTVSKTQKLLNFLSNGKERTSDQIANRTGLQNVSSAVHRLREQGVTIYTNTRGRKGSKFNVYRMSAQ